LTRFVFIENAFDFIAMERSFLAGIVARTPSTRQPVTTFGHQTTLLAG
jgi:hypothetical protein